MGHHLNNKTILVTGGTGSFGKAIIKKIFKCSKPKKVIVFSRDELKQFEMSNEVGLVGNTKLRYFIGDVRDLTRVKLALREVDIVIHAAALKQILTAEYNPIEAIKTNIIGAQNIIEASLDSTVQKVIALSTDKAVDPINLYGATKLAADKLFIAANNLVGKKKLHFSVVRYGNVVGSRGSVLPFFKKLIDEKSNFLPITDKKMTRFFITLNQATAFVINSLNLMSGGEIFVPKTPSAKIIDLALALKKENQKIKITGIRPGEKLHEILISNSTIQEMYEFKDFFILLPEIKFFNYNQKNISKLKYKKIKGNFSYASDSNEKFLNKKEILKLVNFE